MRLALLALAVVLASPVASTAAEANVAVIRVESLDAVLADVQRLADTIETDFSAETLPGLALQPLGIGDASWLDRSRPMALVFPVRGMALGAKGLLGVLPVKETEPALQALAAGFAETTRDEEQGIWTLSREDGTSVSVLPAEGYLLVGFTRELVLALEPDSVLNAPDLPPGSLAAEIFVDPIAPLVQLGLQTGRHTIEQQMKQELQTREAEEKEGEGEEDAASPEMDPELALAFLGVYFDLINDMINNTSRLQFSLEVGTGDIIVHERMLPRAGSTLEGLLEAQKGGLPELARHVTPDDWIVVAGQLTFTPAFIEAVQGYLGKYLEVMQGLGDVAGDGPAKMWFDGAAEAYSKMAESWAECYRGDFAGSMGFDAETGIRGVQIYGAKDPERCRQMLSESARLTAGMRAEAGGEPMAMVTEDALVYGGVTATRQEMSLPSSVVGQEAPVPNWLSAGPLVSYFGLSGDLVLSATGPDAEDRFKGLVDRLAAGKSREGITAESFAPLRVGPGIFANVDLGRMAEMFLAAAEETAEVEGAGADAELEDSSKLFGAFREGGGRCVYGARLDSTALNVEFTVPLKLLEVVGGIISEARAAQVQPKDRS